MVLLALVIARAYTFATMFAIIDIAGAQERVEEGMKLRVPLLPVEPGKAVSIDKVLLLARSDSDVSVGDPYVSGATVEIGILGHGRDDKVRVVKFRRRKRYMRVHGHQQGYTEVEVKNIKLAK